MDEWNHCSDAIYYITSDAFYYGDRGQWRKLKQGENKMARNERLGDSITTTTPGPMRYAGGVIPSVGIGLVTPTNHQVKIDKVVNGFIVEIGCKKFVAEDWKSLAIKLGEYWKDPVAAEKKYAK